MLFRLRHRLGQRRVARAWERLASARLRFSGAVPELRVLPLIDYFTAAPEQRGEAAVAYLIDAGERRLLLDLGAGQTVADGRTRLRFNLESLGLAALRCDGVVVTHNHYDHVGGLEAQARKRPNLEQLPEDLWSGAPVWTPIEMRHPRATCRAVPAPVELFAGIGFTGPLPSHLFFLGSTPEQALLVNLGERGTALVCGCGHPGILEMVRFAKNAGERPVRAVVGGLHLLVGEGRTKRQKRLGANHAPGHGPSAGDVRRIAEELRALGVEQVAPSAHDSCDVALGILRDVFGGGYHEVRVGDEIRIPAYG